MRLLAFSDIHDNVASVRKLRASESNSFDAVVVAGDIGSAAAEEFFRIITTFECPVLYVFGNWDRALSYKKVYGDNCHLLHANVVRVGDLNFTGFSGCPSNWGKNPIARQVMRNLPPNDAVQGRLAASSILDLNRRSVQKAVKRAAIDLRKCVVVTHERLARLGEALPGALLHLYGHIHRYSDQLYRGTRYIDVAPLDRPLPVRPKAKAHWTVEDCANVNAGNYAKIEINSSQEITAECVHLRRDYPAWLPLTDSQIVPIGWIPEEEKWANSSRVAVEKFSSLVRRVGKKNSEPKRH
jgi:predicted phosphodiesterase